MDGLPATLSQQTTTKSQSYLLELSLYNNIQWAGVMIGPQYLMAVTEGALYVALVAPDKLDSLPK